MVNHPNRSRAVLHAARITSEQFAALCQLIRAKPGPVNEAARLMLVEGANATQAAEAMGVQPNTVHHAARRLIKAHTLAKRAA